MAYERFLGRWDLAVGQGDRAHPAWLELTECSGGVHGRYVGIWGSARPVASISIEGDSIRFSLPTQYEGYPHGLSFEGRLLDGSLVGTACLWEPDVPWVGAPAPTLERSAAGTHGEPIDLIQSGLSAWRSRSPESECHWTLQDGALVNRAVGSDLVSRAVFEDFRLEAEYSYPAGSNSGIYLRGRYEFQIVDDYGKPPTVGSSGAIYGFAEPSCNAVKPAGERNVALIELVGRTVTVSLNNVCVVERFEIPGITGGALDSDEGAAGPILLQGDHGPVTFHRLVVTPIK